jgi:hypothetical protein
MGNPTDHPPSVSCMHDHQCVTRDGFSKSSLAMQASDQEGSELRVLYLSIFRDLEF